MTLFLIIGGIGLALLLISLIVGDLVDGLVDSLFEVGGDWISGPALAALLGVFGFGGAIALNAGASTPVAAGLGLVSGLLVGTGVGWVSTRLARGGDHGTVRTASLIGQSATVVTAIPRDGFGTVSVVVAGQITSLNARSAAPIPSGSAVVITTVLSPTSVAVVRPGVAGIEE